MYGSPFCIGFGSQRLLGPLYSGKKYPKTIPNELKTNAKVYLKKGEVANYARNQ